MRASAGLLVYRNRPDETEVLLVHPGGPFWASRDLGAWSLPKGQIEDGEEPLAAAIREFKEETGLWIEGSYRALSPIRQRSGKVVHAWIVEGDFDVTSVTSQLFSMEWPPRSGRFQEFPEVDRAAWFPLAEARRRLIEAQVDFIDQLAYILANPLAT